eukprot:CAMPEP_0185911746 /NCGR_PEP_ID=MMETSP0196C-20130402/32822_1 /TAXON_ID=2932 /ORGANISM="Alexandrium fundyense, Strain CCMP1719" /LENGTH=45 /DNA_ID= /DNA_START= /DNA_END= /DNA_ORIENTATION=
MSVPGTRCNNAGSATEQPEMSTANEHAQKVDQKHGLGKSTKAFTA